MKKQMLAILLLIVYTFNIYAQTGLQGDNEKSHKIIDLQLLAARICALYVGDSLNIVEDAKKIIRKHMVNVENIKDPTNEQMIEFLNENKNLMTCGDEAKNYMMVSFERGVAYKELFLNLFLKVGEFLIDKETFIDINAISYSGENNTPETVLDYMIRTANDPTISSSRKLEIDRLISVFTRAFGAKTYEELPQEEKDAFLNIDWEEIHK